MIYLSMKELRKRILEKFAYRYYITNNDIIAEVCWQKAEKLLAYIDKRKTLIKRLMK